jgi:bifunctional DNA-binding transcriptional regulator/antitoxin component of YhaV-PrlF toxin-antitoxin module
MKEVKHARRRGHTRLSRKHQATIPVDALREAGLAAGDELQVEAAGPGRIVLVRVDDPVRQFAGCLPDVYPRDYLQRLREEWR